MLHCPWPHPPPRPSQENNVEVGKLWEFRGGRCNKYFHNSTVYTGGKRHTNVTLQGSGRRREMQHGSVGFRPPCGQKCNVPRCNCSVGLLPHCHAAFSGGWPAGREMQHGSVGFGPPCGHKCSVPRCNCSVWFLPHCHAAFLGGRGGHKPGFQISYFSDSDLFLGFWPFGLVKGAFGTKRDPKRAKRKIGLELWSCGIICYIALGPKSPRDPPKKQNWKLKSSEDSGGGNVTNNSTIQQFHSSH